MITKGKFKDGNRGWKSVPYSEENKVGSATHEIHWSDDGECVAEVVHGEDDARLIAAAPDLLGALEYYFAVLDEVRGPGWGTRPDHVLQRMMVAASKATGKTYGQ